MARQKNDGKGRLGGRAKGTPNRITASVKAWIFQVIDKNRLQMEKDIEALEPKERLQVLEKLMQYVIPKQQAVSANLDISRLSDEQLNTLVEELTKDIDDGNND
ncbi:MAG TPA: hypothetical protein IAA13_04455 [Candidatus Alistipes merdigallinarum]|nr:hypothetical protein [Candidatus Alistipes merdigallinarum]